MGFGLRKVKSDLFDNSNFYYPTGETKEGRLNDDSVDKTGITDGKLSSAEAVDKGETLSSDSDEDVQGT